MTREFTNHDGDAEDNVDRKKIASLCFSDESGDTLKSFALLISVKIIAKLNPEHSNKFQIKF